MAQNSPDMLSELGRLKGIMADVQFIQAKADAETAYAWFKIAAERGFFVYLESKKLPTLQKLITAATAGKRQSMVEKLKIRQSEIHTNISQALENYSASLRQLETLGENARQEGQGRYMKFLLENDAAEQVWTAKLVAKHIAALVKTKRATPKKWQDELTTLGQ